MRVLIAGGGTGGHIFPALAVASALIEDNPEAKVLFVGAKNGLEERLVKKAGYPIELLSVGKLKGASAFSRLKTFAGLPFAVQKASRILYRFDPDVVVGVGGYASGPIALASKTLMRPLVILEQNAIAGTTNRVLAKLADKVVTSFATTPGFPDHKEVCLGNPLRTELVKGLKQKQSLDNVARNDRCSRLLVLGGSQGAQALNELMISIAPMLKERVEVFHQTGPAQQAKVKDAYYRAGIKAKVEAFVEDMTYAYTWADLVFCRAGATTIAELALAGLPAVLVPYPYAANDHQAANAREVVEAGGARMERQDDLDSAKLSRILLELLDNWPQLVTMSQAMKSCARPNAARDVVKLLYHVKR